ncbi:MAG: transcription termination factor Rho [Roseibacillus sp.]|nr:transcription termination factor Rho [Roseibacillus sp.]
MSSDPPSDAIPSPRSGETPDHPGRNPGEKRDNGGGKNRRRRGGPVRGRVRGRVRRRGNDRKRDDHSREIDEGEQRKDVVLSGPPIEVDGMLELAPKGFGFLRRPEKDFEQSREDVFLPPELVRREGLRLGMWIHGIAREGNRGPQLVEVTSVNGMAPKDAAKLAFFEELKATNPVKRIPFETESERFTTRVIDMIAPIGRGQRGLIVSPPRSGKTTLLLHLAEAARERHSENLHLMVLLVDERPEEVTEFKRQLPEAEIYASSSDMQAKNHCRLAELCIERAKRLVEAGKDVFLLLDSIPRLARAYNNSMRGGKGRGYQTGGIVAGALEMPRRLFAAARNTREAGSLTIIGTALIQTNAKADEAIFQEFKGTGNMELVLDRKIAESFIYPAIDIFKSGTRREELLLPEHLLHKIYLIRRGLSGHRPLEAMERLLFFLKKFPNNAQMLLEIKG